MKNIFILILTIQLLPFIFYANLIQAGQHEVIQNLMNEPASLFDIGLMKLDTFNKETYISKTLEKLSEYGLQLRKHISKTAIYDPEKDTISMSLSLVGKPSEKKCLDVLRIYLETVAPNTNKYVMLGITSPFAHAERFFTEETAYNFAMSYRLKVVINDKQENSSEYVGCECGIINREPKISFSRVKK
jgi:hypothetical protein